VSLGYGCWPQRFFMANHELLIYSSWTALTNCRLKTDLLPIQSSNLLLALASTVIPGIRPCWDPRPYFSSLQTFTCFKMGPFLWREDESVYYWSLPLYWGVTCYWFTKQSILVNCCWPSSAWWFLVPSPTGLVIIFHQSSLCSLGSKMMETPPPTAPLLLCHKWVSHCLAMARLLTEALPSNGQLILLNYFIMSHYIFHIRDFTVQIVKIIYLINHSMCHCFGSNWIFTYKYYLCPFGGVTLIEFFSSSVKFQQVACGSSFSDWDGLQCSCNVAMLHRKFSTVIALHISNPGKKKVKLSLCLTSFTPRSLNPQERAPGTHCIGGWVNPRAGLEDMEKWKFLTLPGLEVRPLGHPAGSQSLYRLRYPGSLSNPVVIQI
jgi:hypothetical protein